MKNKSTSLFPVLLSLMLAVASCKKEGQVPVPPVVTIPVMEYFDLNNAEVRAGILPFTLDVDHDGRIDLAFGTLLVGDPLSQADKLQFLVLSNEDVNLPVNGNEEIPVLNTGDLIVPGNFNGYQWFELSAIILVQKITFLNAPVAWEGKWKNAIHKYVPYQVIRNNALYNGWVDISINIPGEKVVLHKAAISKEPGKIAVAGK